MLIGGLIAGLVAFFLGWLVFGILLDSWYESNMTHYEGLEKAEPIMWSLVIANIALGFLLAYVMNASNANSIAKGFTCGFIVFLLLQLGFNMFMYSFMNMMNLQTALVDVAINAFFGGIVGAIVGFWYSRSPKPAVS